MNYNFSISILFLACGFGVAGCSVSGGYSPGRSDFIAGQYYVMKKPAYVFTHNKKIDHPRKRLQALGYALTPTNVDEFILSMQANPRVAGLLMPGDEIKITKVVADKSVIMGELTDVWALVVTGLAKGMEVEISGISKSKKPSYAVVRDPEYVDPLDGRVGQSQNGEDRRAQSGRAASSD